MLPFIKCHANGNDFILILSDNYPKEFRTNDIISRLCCRHTGIGADGLFIVSPSEKYDFFLDYYNSDGSWETLCANGSRCAVQFMHQSGHIDNKTVFCAGDGSHSAEILENGAVSMQMNTPKYLSGIISTEGSAGFSIDSGAPHFVSESKNLDDDFVFLRGNKIRLSKMFQPRGINVNFYNLIDKNNVNIKTYEKGVESVVLSCASGSTAVIFHLFKKDLIESPVVVRSIGGNLVFKFDNSFKMVWIEGPAVTLFYGEFNLDTVVG